METVQAIFDQLGIDSSFFYQFAVVVVMFILTKILFLNKLQFVLEKREEKTSKLEDGAGETLDKANQILTDYQAKIEHAYQLSQAELTEHKQNVMHKENARLKQAQAENDKKTELAKNKVKEEYEAKKSSVLKDSDELAQLLVGKVT